MLTFSTNSIQTTYDETDVSILRARRHGYDNTVHVVKYLFDELDRIHDEEERMACTIKIFAAVNANPSMLIYEPGFRNSVVAKMTELENYLEVCANNLKRSKYIEALQIFRQSVGEHIYSAKTRTKIYMHIREIAKTLTEYATLPGAEKLRTEFAFLKDILQRIQSHPDYVIVEGLSN
jgi:hypothetical protein